MKLRPFGLSLWLATLTVAGGWAQSGPPAVVLSQPIQATGATVDVSLHSADAATLAQTLSRALGGKVRLEGNLSAPVTLDLAGATVHAALDAVAGAVSGTWRPVYRVTAGAASPAAARPVPLGRQVNAILANVSARAAFALVARAGGGTLELPPDLDQRVNLVANDLPVEQALDELAKQTGAAWSVTYLLKPGVILPSPRPQPSAAGTSPAPRSQFLLRGTLPANGSLPRASLKERDSFPMPGTGDNAGKMLVRGLTRVMQMPPAQRQSAVREFALQLDQQFLQVQSLPPPRRLEQMTAMRPVYQAALRTYNGLVPAQRREFQPIIEVFSRWVR
jgi:hypothetical protein